MNDKPQGKLQNMKAAAYKYLNEFLDEVFGGNETDAEFMSDVNSATLQGASRNSHLILWATFIFFIVAFLWSAFATLDEVTTGEGKIIPSSKIQIIQNLEGGILSNIYVKEGDIVEKGQALLQLDDTRFSSTYHETQLEYLSLLARMARLESEISESPFEAPEIVLKEKPELAANEEALYESRKTEFSSSIAVFHQQETQKLQELTELTAKKEQLERSYELLYKELKMSEPLVAEGALSEVELLRLRRSANNLKGDLEAAKLSMPRIESTLEEVRGKKKELKAMFQNKATSELNKTKSELSQIIENIRALKDRVTRTTIRSPVKGTVKQLKVATIGGVIQPGSDIVEIVPLEDTLLVEANIRPADIAFLRPGQDVIIKLTAYDFSIYGGLPATLEHISADTIMNENGDSFYRIHVRAKTGYLTRGNQRLEIISGMTVAVDILTGEKTVLEYLLKPILKAKNEAMRER